jgi:hypothetical protein
MKDERWQEIERVPDTIQAEILRGLLEAQEIKVWLSQEGAGRALGLSFTPMGEVLVMVPTSQVALAKEILTRYFEGNLEGDVTDKEFPTNLED